MLDSLIFFPDRFVGDPPSGIEERWITTADGLRLHAWYAAAPGRAPTLVWSHGNAGNIAGRQDVLLALASREINVLAYDYRGYGRSEGRPTEEGVYLDAQAVYDSERARSVEPDRIVCFGESLGGAVSIELALRRPCAGLAVVSTFTHLRGVGRHHYGPLAALAGNRFDSLAKIRKISVPIFVAHGDRDEVVPYGLGEELYAAASEPKRFFRARGCHHNDVFDCPGLIDALAGFAREAAAGTVPSTSP